MSEMTVEEYLPNLSSELQEVTTELCTVARKNMPGAGKRMRPVKVRSVEDANNPAFGKLSAATWKDAPESIAKIRVGRRKSES